MNAEQQIANLQAQVDSLQAEQRATAQVAALDSAITAAGGFFMGCQN